MYDTNEQANIECLTGFVETLNKMDWEGLKDYIDDDYHFYPAVDKPMAGIEGFAKAEYECFSAFPGFSFLPDRLIVDGDDACAWMIFDGVHTGCDYLGVPPQGNHVHVSIAIVFKMRKNKILEMRPHMNLFDIFTRLGADMDKYFKMACDELK